MTINIIETFIETTQSFPQKASFRQSSRARRPKEETSEIVS